MGIQNQELQSPYQYRGRIMGILLEKLAEKKYLVSDGAWGTLLQANGMGSGDCPEEWNISHPDLVRSIASEYASAGADMVLTNTFGGSPIKLKRYRLEDRTEELNEAGARLSLEGAPGAVVTASVGPTGEFLAPLGDLSAEELRSAFYRQITALLKGGVKAVCIETMTAIEEAVCAVQAAVQAAKALSYDTDIICTMTFDASPGGFKTMMGVDLKTAVRELSKAGADIIGSNCGNGIEQMIPITRELGKLSEKPILIQANAGLPKLRDGQTVFLQTPEDMAARVEELIKAGAFIIGGCCGTGPDHIRAIKTEVDRFR